MKNVVIFPTWVLYLIVYPSLPATHRWKQQPKFTLDEWANGSTALNFQMSAIIWLYGSFLFFLFGVLRCKKCGST